jgi:hypothetical protein
VVSCADEEGGPGADETARGCPFIHRRPLEHAPQRDEAIIRGGASRVNLSSRSVTSQCLQIP